MCGEQERNIFNRIFGGFLMRKAYELGWANACSFGWELGGKDAAAGERKNVGLTLECLLCVLQRVSAESGGCWWYPLPETCRDRLPAAALVAGQRVRVHLLCSFTSDQCCQISFCQNILLNPSNCTFKHCEVNLACVLCVCFRCVTRRGSTSRSEFTARCSTRCHASTTPPTSSTSPSLQTETSPTSFPTHMEVSTHRHTQTHTHRHTHCNTHRWTQTMSQKISDEDDLGDKSSCWVQETLIMILKPSVFCKVTILWSLHV